VTVTTNYTHDHSISATDQSRAQECLIYTGPDSVSEPYCADTCAPGTCGDEEACNLEAVQCVRDPCPDVAVCSEPCSDCPENQVREKRRGCGALFLSESGSTKPCGIYV